MHNLQVERFYKPVMINGRFASSDGPIKTFPLRGIKDSPPYLHDGRLLTLDDTVEFFNLVLGTKLTAAGEAGPGAVHAGSVTVIDDTSWLPTKAKQPESESQQRPHAEERAQRASRSMSHRQCSLPTLRDGRYAASSG